MNSPSKSRRRTHSGWAAVAITVASLTAHAAVVASTDLVIGGIHGSDLFGDARAIVKYEFGCWSDAGLRMSAEALRCTLPGMRSDACTQRALETFRIDLIVCDGMRSESDPADASVAYMSAAEVDAIEPMPMLDVPELDEFEVAKLLEEEIEEKVAEAEKQISNPKQSGQIVEVLAPQVEARPDNARFLSEYDTRVEKETVARGSTEEMVNTPGPKELPVDSDPDELPDDPRPAGEESESEVASAESKLRELAEADGAQERSAESPLLAMRAQEFREENKIGEESGVDAAEADGLATSRGNSSIDQSAQRAREGQDEVSGQAGSSSSIPNLRPSDEIVSRLAGGGSVDKIDGAETGDFTALNSKKWKFASFFNRMKRQVAQNWHPDTVYLRRDPTGKVYGTKNRVTVLEVSLRPNGSLAKVVVSQQSGVGFLDDEAISAFHKAQPFPNPPRGLVESSSELITFSFGFHFQVGSRRDTWNIFKYN